MQTANKLNLTTSFNLSANQETICKKIVELLQKKHTYKNYKIFLNKGRFFVIKDSFRLIIDLYRTSPRSIHQTKNKNYKFYI